MVWHMRALAREETNVEGKDSKTTQVTPLGSYTPPLTLSLFFTNSPGYVILTSLHKLRAVTLSSTSDITEYLRP